jgi:hypothetical protein
VKLTSWSSWNGLLWHVSNRVLLGHQEGNKPARRPGFPTFRASSYGGCCSLLRCSGPNCWPATRRAAPGNTASRHSNAARCALGSYCSRTPVLLGEHARGTLWIKCRHACSQSVLLSRVPAASEVRSYGRPRRSLRTAPERRHMASCKVIIRPVEKMIENATQ